ncbi:MAG: hypothetical protein JNL08_07150 [Planctomycetes bacterium]|nr:hypothetical protein [Planctomycetota bacterium]
MTTAGSVAVGWPRRATWFVAAVAVAAWAVHRDAWPWIADDAFISLRYAANLVDGHGLCWNPGERVEGYSNLLWVLLSAALLALGVDPVAAVRGLALCAAAAVLATLAFSRLLPRQLPAQLALLLVPAQASFALWAIGGLETPLVMLCVAWAMLGLTAAFAAAGGAPDRRWLAFAGAALALLAWTRPDGPLWAAIAAAVVGWLARRDRPVRALVALLLLPTAAVVAQLTFRLAYYGEWIPNTGHAKVSPLAVCLQGGWHYLLSAGVALRSLLLPALLGLLLGTREPRLRAARWFATIGVVVWTLYVLRVGGDVFPRSRFVAVAFAPLGLLAALGIAALAARGRAGTIAAWIVALAALGLARYDAERPTADERQQLSRWEWDAVAIGRWLGTAFGPADPLLAIDAAGAVPFYSHLRTVDMLGLCDATIAKTPLAADRVFVVGHNRGNGAYVLARQPDLLLFNIPGIDPVPHWKSGTEMIADPRFFAGHRLVLCDMAAPAERSPELGPHQFLPWLRLDGRLGVQPQGDALRVPGYLFGSWRQPFPLTDATPGMVWLSQVAVAAILDPASRMPVGEVRRAGRHALQGLTLPAGSWRATADGLPAGVTLALVAEAGAFDLVLDVPAATPVPFVVPQVLLRRDD